MSTVYSQIMTAVRTTSGMIPDLTAIVLLFCGVSPADDYHVSTRDDAVAVGSNGTRRGKSSTHYVSQKRGGENEVLSLFETDIRPGCTIFTLTLRVVITPMTPIDDRKSEVDDMFVKTTYEDEYKHTMDPAQSTPCSQSSDGRVWIHSKLYTPPLLYFQICVNDVWVPLVHVSLTMQYHGYFTNKLFPYHYLNELIGHQHFIQGYQLIREADQGMSLRAACIDHRSDSIVTINVFALRLKPD